jgi:hypothetical protein
MATRVLNQDKIIDLLRQYRPGLSLSKSSGGTREFVMLCPFHTDTIPSFVYIPLSDRGFCRSCDTSVNTAELYSRLEGVSEVEAAKFLKDGNYYETIKQEEDKRKPSTINISFAQIKLWQEALKTNVVLRTCIKKWGWTDAMCERLLLGACDKGLSIPMFENEELVNVKFYDPSAPSGKRHQNTASSHNMVWPLENLKKDIVYIVEGEKDCMTMLSAGFNAVTFTGGAGSIPKSYLKFFAGREVVIIYDIDEAGRKGAVNLANALTRISLSTRIVDLPPGELPPKGDLTNFYEKLGDQFADRVRALVAHSDNYVSVATSRVLIPEDIEETYLEDIVKRKLFYRRVRMKVRVVNNAQNETFVIPRDVCLQCNRDWKANICEACPLFYEKEGINMVIKPEYPEILTMIDNDLKKQKEALRSLCNIAEKCPRLKVEYRAFQALYPIVIIPAIEADKPSHNYSLVGAYALDVPSQENEDYLVEAVVLASPETQGLSIVCYKMERDNASLDDFELSDEMKNRLKIFQAKDEECVDQPLQQSTQN